jgi:L-lactate dehydrogenase complex protein LldG
MSSRDRIMAKVRAGVAAGQPVASAEAEAERRANVAERLAAHRRHLIPARVAGKDGQALVAEMRRWLEAAGAEMIEVASAADVPRAVAEFLRRHNLPQRVRMGADPRLGAMPWQSVGPLDIVRGTADRADTASVTHALAAVAETGTLVVPSGPDNPVTLSFLPENNVIVVARGDVVGPLEDAVSRLRGAASGAPAMPRTLNLISGPSRSADIGGIPVLGAHGPKRFAVIVVGA